VTEPGEFSKRARAAIENHQEFKLFFHAVELWVNQEIDVENAKRGKAQVSGATKIAGKSRFLGERSLEIRFGSQRGCFLSLNPLDSAIEAEIDGDQMESFELPSKRETRFRLENHESGAKAFMIGTVDGSTAETEMGPREIAQVVVAGVVRGYFA
jgi:hypothetical protein